MLLPALVATLSLSFVTARPLSPGLQPRAACTHGTWLCAANTLSVCMDGAAVPIWVCGDGSTCVAEPYYRCMEGAPANAETTTTLDSNTLIVLPSGTCEEGECPEGGSGGSAEAESTSAPAATASAESTANGPTSAPEPTAAPESTVASEATSTASTVEVESRSEVETTIDDHTISQTATTLLSTVASTVGSSAVPSASFATGGTGTKHTTPQVSFAAPHYAIYSDFWFANGQMPTVQQLGHYNRLILTMWTVGNDIAIMDNALLWTQLDAATRRRVLDEYHAAGIALMVVALGDVSQPTSQGRDPIPLAQELAKFVIEWELDGVDIDYEDFAAVNNGKSAAWVIAFHNELRSQLGSAYLISHAPVAPFISPSRDYADGAYITINKEIGNTIDFYMVQYHNQGNGSYTDCQTLIYDSTNLGPNSGTSTQELHDLQGIPYDKLVIGKPLIPEDTRHGGYMSPETLGECYQVAKGRGFTPGISFWHWHGDVDNAGILSTIIGG